MNNRSLVVAFAVDVTVISHVPNEAEKKAVNADFRLR